MKNKKEKPKYNMWQITKFMIKTAWVIKEKKVLVLSFLIAILTILINLTNLFVVPTILSLIENQVGVINLVIAIISFIGGLALLNSLLNYINVNIIFGKITIRLALMADINNKALTTSYPNAYDDEFKKLLSKSVNSTLSSNSSSGEAIWQTLTNLLINIIGFIIYTILFVNIGYILILSILITSLLSYLVNKRLSKYSYNHKDEEADTIRSMSYITHQAKDYKAVKDIRIFGLKPWFDEIYAKTKKAYLAYHNKAEGIYFWGNVLDVTMSILRNGLAYYYLINLILNGSISIAEFVLYFSAVSSFSEWVVGILNNFNILNKQSIDISILRESLEFKEVFKFDEGEKLTKQDIPYQIELKNVSYRYPNTKKDILSNINLTLHPQEKLAIVGLNGAGKTTLIKLICGFLDPTEGEVLLNGEDIRKYNRNDYYSLFSAVFQQFSLLPSSISSNVAQNENDIDMDLVKECVEKAGLKEKVESLTNGYETKLNRDIYEDAVMLSGGQTQRLMLARALYRNSPFIILDEPTAALAPIAESKIYNRYNEMTKDKSSIFISHRLASTRFCDRIIMLDNGNIVEEGTHQELLDKGGKYYQLYEVQSKYYKEGEEDGE